MQKPLRVRSTTRATKSRRKDFESGLNAYSTAGKAAIAAGVVVGAVSARGQTITNITSANFAPSGHLTWQITTPLPPSTVSGSVQNNEPQLGVYLGHNTYGFRPNVTQGNGTYNMGGTVAVGGLGKIAQVGTRSAANLARHAQVNAADFGGGGLRTYRLFHTSTFGNASTRLGGQGNPAFKGNFVPTVGHPATGYLGFKMGTVTASGAHNGNFYFGWLRVQVAADSNGRPDALTILPVAGNVVGAYVLSNDPNVGSFGAGDISAIPEPASVATGLALFALGAAGVREHRRRKKLAA